MVIYIRCKIEGPPDDKLVTGSNVSPWKRNSEIEGKTIPPLDVGMGIKNKDWTAVDFQGFIWMDKCSVGKGNTVSFVWAFRSEYPSN